MMALNQAGNKVHPLCKAGDLLAHHSRERVKRTSTRIRCAM
ncbi:MAG: hypothetical protein O7E52_19190 [Candidatus Poribacteria bacterium]|nr:hypothetical protein [Candidatus Poribacteria bacterium]